MKKWLNYEFSSGSYAGEDFKSFSKSFKKALQKQLPEGTSITKYSCGHYYVSGFIEQDGKFIYFSISDVRYFKNEWFTSVLYRTAKNNKDFTGGQNMYSSFLELGKNVTMLFSKMEANRF